MGRNKSPSSEDPIEHFTDAQLDVLAKLSPQHAKAVTNYRDLLAKAMQARAATRGGFATSDPLEFSKIILGVKPTAAARAKGYTTGYTPDQIRILHAVRDHQRVAIPAGHGVGKTHLLATIILWFLLGKKGSIVITTAPTFDVVKMQIWKNIHDTYRASKIPLPGRLLDTQLDMGGKWYAIGITTNRPGAFHGHHGTRTMVVGDEAVDIAEEINDEAESMILGPEDRYLLSYNPTDPTTWVKRVTDTGLWHICRVSAEDHPNVIHDDPTLIPGAVTRQRVQQYEELYGGKDSPGYMARVQGKWPATAEDTLISYDVIARAQKFEERQALRREAAGGNHVEERIRGGALGIDVAGEGSDLMICWEIYDSVARVLWHTQHRDLMESVGRIMHTIQQGRGRYQVLAIDDTGIGAGVSSRLLELQSNASKPNVLATHVTEDPLLNCAIVRVNFAERPTTFAQRNIFPQFWRIKDEMWWNLRLVLQRDQLGLPSDTQLLKYGFPRGSSMVAQLSAPFFENESRGIIHVYDKYSDSNDRTKTLPRKSPDIAHGLILANHAYRLLRPEFAADPPKTMLELRQRNFAALIHEYKRREIENDSESKTILLDDVADEDNYGPDFYRFLQ